MSGSITLPNQVKLALSINELEQNMLPKEEPQQVKKEARRKSTGLTIESTAYQSGTKVGVLI